MAKAIKKAATSKPKVKRKTERKKVISADGSQPIKRIRTAKGRRPYFHEDPNTDKIVAMLMALIGEVSVIRERLDTHERLAEKDRQASIEAVEKYKANDEVSQERAEWRDAYIGRVLRILTVELDQLKDHDDEKRYQRVIKEVSKA